MIYSYNPETGALSQFSTLSGGPTSTHMSLIKGNNGYIVYSTSWGGGFLRKNNFDSSMKIVGGSSVKIDYGSTAKAHSTAFDSKRNLLFVAVMGTNQIFIYKVNLASGDLTPVGMQVVTNPRTVIYDSAYDKIYLATEGSVGSSYIQAFSINEMGTSIYLKDEGSLSMPLYGADIKIDHNNRYVLATARESGKESVWGMPLTSTGSKDSSRSAFSFNVNAGLPRALEISEDGKYVMVGMSTGSGVNVRFYKLNYDTNLKFTKADVIYEDSVGNGWFNCSLSIPVK